MNYPVIFILTPFYSRSNWLEGNAVTPSRGLQLLSAVVSPHIRYSSTATPAANIVPPELDMATYNRKEKSLSVLAAK